MVKNFLGFLKENIGTTILVVIVVIMFIALLNVVQIMKFLNL